MKQRSGEEPLQDVVLRSVLVKMVEPRNSETEADQQESIRHISNNLLRFVERVHHEKYSEALMTGESMNLCLCAVVHSIIYQMLPMP